jgi:hypothetical protein
MVLTKSELIASLQNESRILLHLAGKVEPQMRDYRPTQKQRSDGEGRRTGCILSLRVTSPAAK